jgi:Nif-specific regulatory protein
MSVARLTIVAGLHVGQEFPLDPHEEVRIGRGRDCQVMLADDVLCSRVHAVLALGDLGWMVRDAGSRNGTFVNEQEADEALLADGHAIRVGGTELVFHEEAPTVEVEPPSRPDGTQTMIRDSRAVGGEPQRLAAAEAPGWEHAQELLLSYQLAYRLLGCGDSQEAIRIALEVLRERSGASTVAFLWIDDEGELRPKLTLPADAAQHARLSDTLTQMVREQGQAVWVAHQQAGSATESLRVYADAFCVPLVHEGHVLGALHAYTERGRFTQAHFDFAINVARLSALALARTRREASTESALRELQGEVPAAGPGLDEIVGDSPAICELKDRIARLGRAAGCVLVRGESGTGKELVARALHRVSPRADRPLLAINCAALPEQLVESQLFGHKAGAFTGADKDFAGLFRQADLGTLFLDEVGELSLGAQAKLLRVLDGYAFQPVGSTEEVQVDVRVIAATNRDLQTQVRERKFREDLYFRLSVFELPVPPLRERGEDVGRLVDFFLERFRRQHGRAGLELSAAARERLLAYRWPGNVRQLRNVLDSAVVLADRRIEPKDLHLQEVAQHELDSLRLDHWEQKLIRTALERTGGNAAEAAQLLGIGRATLFRKVKEYGIERDR